MARVVALLFRRIQIEGPSMLPTLLPGQTVMATRRWRPVRVGDVVVLPDPHDGDRLIVKRVTRRQGGQLELAGDNPEFSTDSRDFGPVKSSAVQYIVWRRQDDVKLRPD